MFHMTLFVIINCKIVNEGGLKLFQLLRRRFPLFCERNSNYSFRTALACEDIRFSSLFAAGDVSRGGTSPAVACEQALLFGRASRERAARSLARSRETRFARPNRRACSQVACSRLRSRSVKRNAKNARVLGRDRAAASDPLRPVSFAIKSDFLEYCTALAN